MAEATDVEEDRPSERTPKGRSSVDLSLSPRDQTFDLFFLHEKGDRETVRLLMRGTARGVSNYSSWVYERAQRPLAMRWAAPVEIAARARANLRSRRDRGARARVRDRRARIYVP